MHSVPGSWAIHTCRRCGSGTTLPLAREEDLAAFYPSDYAPYRPPRGALATAMGLMQRARDTRFPTSQLDSGTGPGTLLDVGCGAGELAASWIAKGWRVQGVEPSPEAAAVARKRGAEIVGATLTDARVASSSLDAIMFRHSLEHVVDPVRDARWACTALRPGGRVAVIVPNWGSWQRRALGEYWFPLELPRHRTHFTAAGLRATLAAGGLTRIDIRPATPLITTAWSLQFRLFDRLLTRDGAGLLAGYALSVPIGLATRAVDAILHSGDFLHASAEAPRQ